MKELQNMKTANTRQKAERTLSGLTLIEVVLAVSLLSIGLTVLLTAVSRCLNVIKLAKNYQTAQWVLGMGELDYPLIETNDLTTLNVDGEKYLDDFIFSREAEEEDEEKDGLYVVRTKVSISGRVGKPLEEIVQYVFNAEDIEKYEKEKK